MIDSQRPRVISSTPAPPQCPDDLELAQFADGRLSGADRTRLVAHVADCDDCREILVTVMAAGAAARPAEEPAPADTTAVAPRRHRAAVAAALALAALALFALRLGPLSSGRQDSAAAGDPWADIEAAVGPARIVEARLSGLRGHVPLSAPTRAAASNGEFRTRALAARLADAATAGATTAAERLSRFHVAGVAALVAGQAADAVVLLDRALAEGEAAAATRAAVLSDLSAAHAELGDTNGREHWALALRAAEEAVTLDGSLAAARFNRALALEHVGRADAAREAWREVAGDTALDDAWRREALTHVHRLTVP